MSAPKTSEDISVAALDREESHAAIFVRFLKFGCLAWGGPAAQIAMIKLSASTRRCGSPSRPSRNLLAVYQIVPGPEAHELCVYFGQLRGGKLGGFLAGLGFMLLGFILMLGLSILHVEANLAGHLSSLFYGLTPAVGALVARALVRLSKSFISDVPLAIIAIVGFALTLWVGITFVLVLLAGGVAYELWTNGRRWTHRANSFAIGPLALVAVVAGGVTVSLTATIFTRG
jgi:chromate transporter